VGHGAKVGLASRSKRTIDLRFDQNVVWAADHDQMLDVIPPDQDKLSLPIEAERIHETQSRLPRPPSRNAQTMGEDEPVEDRQNNQGRDPAGSQKPYLKDRVVGKRKTT
jgi:hypothetical protein